MNKQQNSSYYHLPKPSDEKTKGVAMTNTHESLYQFNCFPYGLLLQYYHKFDIKLRKVGHNEVETLKPVGGHAGLSILNDCIL